MAKSERTWVGRGHCRRGDLKEGGGGAPGVVDLRAEDPCGEGEVAAGVGIPG